MEKVAQIIGYVTIGSVGLALIYLMLLNFVQHAADTDELKNSRRRIREDHDALSKRYWDTFHKVQALEVQIDILKDKIKDLTEDKKDGNIEL